MHFPFPFGLFLPVVTTLRDVATLWVRSLHSRSWLRALSYIIIIMGQVLVWHARRRSGVLHPFSLCLGFEPLSEASLRALSYRWVLLVVLTEAESLRLSLALSSVLPCPMLWLHVRLPDPCSGSEVVLGTLP